MRSADVQFDRAVRIEAGGRWKPALGLAVLGLALWSWSGGLWDIWNESDARWIMAIREKIAEGEFSTLGRWPLSTALHQFILITNHGVASAWELRFPSVMFGIAAAILCYRIGAFLFGAATGWFAGVIFISTAGLVGAVPSIEPAMMFTVWVTLAIDLWVERERSGVPWARMGLISVCAALATLTAGWAGVAIIAPVLIADWKPSRPGITLAVWIIAGVAATRIDSSLWEATLPAVLPAAALALGMVISRVSGEILSPRLGRKIAAGVIATEIVVLAVGIWMYQEPDFFWSRGFFILLSGLVWLYCLLIVVFLASIALLIRPRTKVLVAGFLVALIAINPVVLAGLRPAMNPSRSGANVSDLLDHYMPAHGRGEVGAIGEADDPRLHVHGRYKVERLPDNAKKIMAKDPPPVLIGRRGDMKDLMPALRKHGYSVSKTILSMNRTFVIARHKKPSRSARPEVLRMIAVGDTGTGNLHQKNVGRRMAEQHDWHGRLAACLLLGDNIYGYDPIKSAFKKRFLDPFEALIERGVPFYAALGNHDHKPASKARFEMKASLFNMGGRNYYAHTFGHDLITVFFIDCETIKSDPAQYLWLENELRNCDSHWKVLINHIPMVASNVLHADNPATFDLLDQLMIDGGIDLVLSGHNHIYERRRLLDGIQYLTVGSGGHVSDDFELPRDEKRSIGYNGASAFAWMEIREEAIRIRAINEFGRQIDEFVISHDEDGRVEVRDVPRPYDWRRDLPTIAQAQVVAFRWVRSGFASRAR